MQSLLLHACVACTGLFSCLQDTLRAPYDPPSTTQPLPSLLICTAHKKAAAAVLLLLLLLLPLLLLLLLTHPGNGKRKGSSRKKTN